MKANVGKVDKIIRIIIGIAIFGVLWFGYHSYWALVGVIPVVTAFVGFCPFYKPMGIDTTEKK